MFLWLAGNIVGVEGAIHLQFILSDAAFVFLGWSVYKVFDAPILALVLVLFLISLSDLAQYQSYILSESLFTTLLCVMMGTLMMVLMKPTWWLIAVSALSCGLAITVRPIGISLLPIWPILLWFIWRRCDGQHIRVIASIVVPIVLCLLTDDLVYRAHHVAKNKGEFVNIHIFAKALMIESEPPDWLDKELTRLVTKGREIMAPARELIDGAPDQRARAYLLFRFEGLAHRKIYQRLKKYEKKNTPSTRR